jgi:hypothetical protein
MRLRGRSRGKGAGRKCALDPDLQCARFVLFAKFFFCPNYALCITRTNVKKCELCRDRANAMSLAIKIFDILKERSRANGGFIIGTPSENDDTPSSMGDDFGI